MEALFLIKIGFLPVGFWDIMDILIVGYLFYLLYKLLHGTIAFNILIGVILFFLITWLIRLAQMDMLSLIVTQIANIGVITLVIIFQPEIRRFLLYLGQSAHKGRLGFLSKYIHPEAEINSIRLREINEIVNASFRLRAKKWGALIVIANKNNVEEIAKTGQILNANISEELLLSIFNKESPLHDGAVVIHNYKIYASGCVLPISRNEELPQKFGLRHRAGIGLTETTNMAVIIISEEDGTITFAKAGRYQDIHSKETLTALIREVY